MKRTKPREEYCMGCRLCEIHCMVQHCASRDIVKASHGVAAVSEGWSA